MSIPSSEIIPLNQPSFRKPLLFVLKTNAKPKVLLKLMQICRYFRFKEFPFHVVEKLRNMKSNWEYVQLGKSNFQKFNFDDQTKPFWITSGIIFLHHENHLPHLLSKTAVCDVHFLFIKDQLLKLDEFQFMISSNAVEVIRFVETQVFYDDGSIVPVDEIVKLLPNLKEFTWYGTDASSPLFTPASTKKLIEYLNPSILTRFEARFDTETFDFKIFAEFMDQNPLIHFSLHFNNQLPNDYAKVLQTYIDQLIESEEYKNRQILIEFPQQNAANRDILFQNLK